MEIAFSRCVKTNLFVIELQLRRFAALLLIFGGRKKNHFLIEGGALNTNRSPPAAPTGGDTGSVDGMKKQLIRFCIRVTF